MQELHATQELSRLPSCRICRLLWSYPSSCCLSCCCHSCLHSTEPPLLLLRVRLIMMLSPLLLLPLLLLLLLSLFLLQGLFLFLPLLLLLRKDFFSPLLWTD